jgi:hypothetical protein
MTGGTGSEMGSSQMGSETSTETSAQTDMQTSSDTSRESGMDTGKDTGMAPGKGPQDTLLEQETPASAPEVPPAPEQPGVPAPVQASALQPPSGPAAGPIVLGLLVILAAVSAFAAQAFDLSLDWGRVLPVLILLGGAALVLLGFLGMRRRGR